MRLGCQFLRFYIDTIVKNLWVDWHWNASRLVAHYCNSDAVKFYDNLYAGGYDPERNIRVAVEQRIIYLAVGKAASQRIKSMLNELRGIRFALIPTPNCPPRYRELQSPRRAGFDTFLQLATSPNTLRFTFVRNPYDRLVSCWAHKIQNKPLIPGDENIGKYLSLRREIDSTLPEGPDRTLSFADFATFAIATNTRRVSYPWNLQSDIIDMPGITLNFIGKVEFFARDFIRVLDHAGAENALRQKLQSRLGERLNVSQRRCQYSDYYTPALADRVYRAYERDFDSFGYSKPLSS